MLIKPSTCFFTADTLRPFESNEAGSIRMMTAAELPGMQAMSLVEVSLAARAYLRPGWRVNADMVGYCVGGAVAVTLHGPGLHERFRVDDGQMFFVPRGVIQLIENIESGDSEIRWALNHGRPQHLMLAEAVQATSIGALKSTIGGQDDLLERMKSGAEISRIGVLPNAVAPVEARAHRYVFDIEQSDRVVATSGGYLQAGLRDNLPVLDGVGILGFGLTAGGAVEPHWHPNSDEVVYIRRGRVRGMLRAPGGDLHSQDLGPGEGFYAPTSYFHSIENIGDEDVEGIAFFNNPDMVYLGLGEAIGAVSEEVLSSICGLASSDTTTLNRPGGPLIIVPA